MGIRQILRSTALHLTIVSVGFLLFSAAFHERFDLHLYLYLVGVNVAYDVWQAWRQHRAAVTHGVTYQEPQEGVWPPPPRSPQ